MRLLNAHGRRFEEFMSDSDVPPYAILSHTWGNEEITLQMWQSPLSELESMHGFQKIQYCCEQAKHDGYDWIWVDTCCIDKTSSAELSEAINSMFQYYKYAAVCYVYLSDIPRLYEFPTELELGLKKSRWFTRGWTLQELIAPQHMKFYTKNWQLLGTKMAMSATLADITGIDPKFLNGGSLELASVAKRMSWASHRNTSRVEDMAYCLLGIFDINMSLIYGEGTKAFTRLQEEILKSNLEDHTLFAREGLVVLESGFC
ncbi:heterokaryon incompatibility protein-domain-containing protein [Bisporella sp. PMI_857]|nr:heterokaryon incompatibility protein-domain-containing protein [Bisporella sp. PMI_857]